MAPPLVPATVSADQLFATLRELYPLRAFLDRDEEGQPRGVVLEHDPKAAAAMLASNTYPGVAVEQATPDEVDESSTSEPTQAEMDAAFGKAARKLRAAMDTFAEARVLVVLHNVTANNATDADASDDATNWADAQTLTAKNARGRVEPILLELLEVLR